MESQLVIDRLDEIYDALVGLYKAQEETNRLLERMLTPPNYTINITQP